MGQSVVKNSKKIFSQPGSDPSLNNRVTNLEDNVYKITYYEIVSGTSGSLTIPTGATINEGEFGTSGNSILSKINVEDKPTYSSPLTSGNVVVTANLNIDGTWTTSGIYTDAQVALVYSVNIKAIDYHNLDNFYIINSEKLISDSVIAGFVPYTGATTNVDLGEFGLSAGQINLDTSPAGTAIVGSTRWNNTNGISETLLKGGNVSLKNGVDLVARVVNNTGIQLTKAAYQVVKISGAQGQRLAVGLAQANNDNNSADTLGLVIETINNNQEGFIMTVGQLEEINTTGSLQGETWVDGDVLYLSPTTPGAITKVKPTGLTGHIVVLGYVEYAHANHGKIYVKIMNGWELEELHDVYIPSYVNNGILYRDTSVNLWKTNTIPNVLGYTPANDLNVVHTTGNETVAGNKTFTGNTIIGNASENLTSFGTLRIGQGNSFLDIGQANANQSNIWMNSATPTNSNYSIGADAVSLFLNAPNQLQLLVAAFSKITLSNNESTFTQRVANSGNFTPFTFTTPSNTNQTASTNIPNFKITGSNKQWATGTLATQYFNYLSANTISFTTSSTATDVFNTFIEAPIAGTNATITNAYSLGTNGAVKFDDGTSKMIWKAVPTVPTYSGIFLNVNPNSSNYSLVSDTSGNTFLNGSTNSYISVNATNVARFNSQFQLHTPVASTSGSTIKWQLTIPNDTGLTASTNIPNFKVTGSTKTWADGNISTQYWNYLSANTAAFTSVSSTITNSYGLFVEAATTGVNATITNNFGIGTDGNILSTSQYLYLGTSNPTLTNFVLRSTTSGLEVNSQSQSAPIYFRLGTSNRFVISKNGTVGAENSFTFLPNNNTNQNASTEISGYLGQDFSRQWIGGNIETQREIYFKAPTYSFTTSSTITNSYGAYFEAAIAGTNATITNNYALGVKGQLRFDYNDLGTQWMKIGSWTNSGTSFPNYGWGIATYNSYLRLPDRIYIGDSSYYIGRFDVTGDPVNSAYGGSFNPYKDFKANSLLNNRIFIYGQDSTGNVSIGAITNANQRGFRVNQDTATIDIGSLVGATTYSAIYFGSSTPNVNNYTLSGVGGSTYLNSTGNLALRISNVDRIAVNNTNFIFSPSSAISGNITPFTFTNPSNITQTASTNIPNFQITGNTKQWNTGNITNQYWNYFTANTAEFVGISTITNSYGLYVEAANASTNATIVNNYAIGTDGNIVINSSGSNKFYRMIGTTGQTGQFSADGAGVYFGSMTSHKVRIIINNEQYTPLTFETNGNITVEDGRNFNLNSTLGTKIGTSTTQKLGFYNATPIVQPSAVTTVQGIANALTDLGLLASSTINTSNDIFAIKPSYVWRGATINNFSTTVVYDGGIVGSATASTTAQSVSSTSFVSKQIRLRYYSTTISGGRYTGLRGSALLWYIHGGFLFTCDFNISDTAYNATCQNFYGMAGQTTDLGYGGAGNVQVSSLTNLIGVGNDTTDTNLQIIHNDATGTATKIDLGVNFPSNRTAGAAMTTVYSILLYNAPASTEVHYRVINNETGDIAEGTLTTDLPATSQGLNIFASRANGTGGGTTGAGEFHLSKLGAYSLL